MHVGESANVQAVIDRATAAAGRSPLSDQLLSDLRAGVGITLTAPGGDGEPLAGLAHVSPRNAAWTMQVVADPQGAAPAASTSRLAADAAHAIRDAGGGPVEWWVFDAGDRDDAVAERLGFVVGRDLLQMGRSLPTERHPTIGTRPFVVGRDEQAWLTVNNRAFAGHPEQSGWDLPTLRQRMSLAWFDPSGFLLHERDGVLAGFCWTKMHGATGGSPIGEIYVIGVDPAFQGLGLGSELTLAGLKSLHSRGANDSMLYVDGASVTAVALYERLGFSVRRRDRAYHAVIAFPGHAGRM